MNVSREKLIAFLESKIIPYEKWMKMDVLENHQKTGEFIALLKAGVPYTVHTDEEFNKLNGYEDDGDLMSPLENCFWIQFQGIEKYQDESLDHCFSGTSELLGQKKSIP